jgi:hypothetical protein
MKNGDIVRLSGRDGLWVYAGLRPADIPSNAIGKFLRATEIDPRNPHEALSFSIASATLVATPGFAPADTVNFQGGTATVESDDGVDTVTLTYGPHKVPVPPRDHAGENFTHSGRAFADRALLVINNLARFVKQEN